MIAGLVLAAGAGTRFGAEPKQLADLGGKPLLEWSVRAQCNAYVLERVVVVLGASADQIREAVDFGRAEIVICDDWERGQSASLRAGARALAGADKVVVTLGDAPLVSTAVVERFAAEPPRTRAVYEGRPGHPVVLGPAELEALAGAGSDDPRGARAPAGGHGARAPAGDQGARVPADQGARALLRGGPVIEAAHLCCGRDVDTPEDLEEIRDAARAVL